MENALKAVYPDAKPNIITLGGSGQGIGSEKFGNARNKCCFNKRCNANSAQRMQT